MYRQKTTAHRSRGRAAPHTRFGSSKKSARFRSASSRFATKRGRPKAAKIDISSFINRSVRSAVPEKVFVAENLFEDFKLSPELFSAIKSKGYTEPTHIQDKIIFPIMQGKDVVGLSNTGTGKTAAFLIPLIEKVLHNPREQIFIVTPTRELALQIEQELIGLTGEMRISSVTCVGGESIGSQIRKLKRKNNFVIGTPGRLLDLVKRGNLILGGVHTVVLDEADRMLDMGFINDIKTLMIRVPNDRQTLCFSATMSRTIEELTKDFLKNPSTISVKTTETPENIEQDVIRVRDNNKIDVLYDLLQNGEFQKVLVFGRTKRGVENLSRILKRKKIRVESIHSDKSQSQRKRALLSFKNNGVQVLVATDVAARGLHIENVTHVINYEVPETYDDYIHRIGRTGRGTQQGKALTFVD
tara:strand:- start:67 stop:1308 length:1242 start_codon:yes stop_codon:yes gene_type:complete